MAGGIQTLNISYITEQTYLVNQYKLTSQDEQNKAFLLRFWSCKVHIDCYNKLQRYHLSEDCNEKKKKTLFYKCSPFSQ